MAITPRQPTPGAAAAPLRGRPYTDRVVEDRYEFKTHHESGNTNYPLEGVDGEEVRAIIERLIYVGIKPDKVIRNLPKEFEPTDWEPKKTGLDLYMDVGVEIQSTL